MGREETDGVEVKGENWRNHKQCGKSSEQNPFFFFYHQDQNLRVFQSSYSVTNGWTRHHAVLIKAPCEIESK